MWRKGIGREWEGGERGRPVWMWKRAETGSAAPGRSLSSSSHPVRHECFISPLSNDQAAEENKSGEWCIAFLCQFFLTKAKFSSRILFLQMFGIQKEKSPWRMRFLLQNLTYHFIFLLCLVTTPPHRPHRRAYHNALSRLCCLRNLPERFPPSVNITSHGT
jgi:hypothetical protein